MPIIPTEIPRIINNPSFPISPKDVINIPNPGIKFERGNGIRIKLENPKRKKPIIFSAIELLISEKRGFKILSILRRYGLDF